MGMSKKDFIALADMIRNHNRLGGNVFTRDQIEDLAGFCREQNPNFNRYRWLDYITGECGPNGGAVKKELTTV